MKTLLKSVSKATLFDKAIIFITLCGFLLFAFIFFRKATYLTVTVKVGEDDVRYLEWVNQATGSRVWFSKLFYEGMEEKDGFGRTNAKVGDVTSYDTFAGRRSVYLTVMLKTVYSRAQNQHTYKGSPVLVGYPIKMFLDKIYLQGLVTDIEGMEDPRQKQALILEAKLVDNNLKFSETTGVTSYVADSIKKGDEIKDNKGNSIIKVIDKRSENAKKSVVTSAGQVLLQTQPERFDVYLIMEVSAVEIDNRYFLYDDIPILIGQTIPLSTPTYLLSPTVTKITEKK